MSEVRLRPKGQVTIPANILERAQRAANIATNGKSRCYFDPIKWPVRLHRRHVNDNLNLTSGSKINRRRQSEN